MSKQQKRLSASKRLKIPRKSYTWVVKSSPGPHREGIPLLVVLRDILGLVDNAKESRYVIGAGKILVDGVPRKNYKFPVGLFDVISIPDMEANFRVVFDEKGRFTTIEVDDADVKLYRIDNKTMVKGGKIQLNLFDGTNIIGDNTYKAKDSLLLSIPDKKIKEHLKYEEGSLAMITGGEHAGEVGVIKRIKVVRSSHPNLVEIEGKYDFTTIEDYVFVVGKDKPVIDIGV
jgi:small subunit ribosomal protein S4e